MPECHHLTIHFTFINWGISSYQTCIQTRHHFPNTNNTSRIKTQPYTSSQKNPFTPTKNISYTNSSKEEINLRLFIYRFALSKSRKTKRTVSTASSMFKAKTVVQFNWFTEEYGATEYQLSPSERNSKLTHFDILGPVFSVTFVSFSVFSVVQSFE